jgi:hypothetical protein
MRDDITKRPGRIMPYTIPGLRITAPQTRISGSSTRSPETIGAPANNRAVGRSRRVRQPSGPRPHQENRLGSDLRPQSAGRGRQLDHARPDRAYRRQRIARLRRSLPLRELCAYLRTGTAWAIARCLFGVTEIGSRRRVMPHPQTWPRQRNPWLFHIGRRLQAEYEAIEAPVPLRLAQLVRKFEMDAGRSGGAPDAGADELHFRIRRSARS